jgi:hypothetical protein
MFAISRDRKRAFLYHPQAGMAVPILLDLQTLKHKVQVPPVSELSDRFVVFENLDDLESASGRPGDIRAISEISRDLSLRHADVLARPDMTVATLRALIESDDLLANQPSGATIRIGTTAATER